MAGSWTDATNGTGTFAGQRFKAIEITWTGDAVDGSVPALTVTDTTGNDNLSGMLVGVRVIFDGSNTPSDCDMTVTDKDGIDLLGGAIASGNALTASGKVSLSPPEAFSQALYINVGTTAGNAGDSAKVVLYVIL